MDTNFLQTLPSRDKAFYETAYDFNIKYCNGNAETAHQAGLDEIKRIHELMDDFEKPQNYVDVSTGRRFRCTEAELMSKYA
jgi:hypothetical protein